MMALSGVRGAGVGLAVGDAEIAGEAVAAGA